MSSPTSRRESLTGRMRNLANMTKPAVDIEIDGSHAPSLGTLSYVQTYSTRDKIQGTVSLTAPYDAKFDKIHISFVGTIRTFVDRIGSTATVNGRTEAFHQFLKLEQPIPDDQYPPSGIAEAGKTYTFPFTFVVPDRLLPGSCKHAVVNSQITDAHLELPPSLGEPDLSGQGPTLLYDLAPDMTKICYAIKVDVYRLRERDWKLLPLVSKQKKVRVIPASSEHPPLTVDDDSQEYCMRKEKNVRKGLFKGKLGRLVVEAAQPPSIHLPAPNSSSTPASPTRPDQSLSESSNKTTMATIMVRFEPESATTELPRLGSLTSKIRAVTFYASGPRPAIPTKATLMYDPSQAVHVENLSLSQRAMSSAQWERHDPGGEAAPARRGSTTSLSGVSIPSPSDTWATNPNRPFYTAQLLVPISLPKNRTFVPTFHSCLISRIYILDLSLSISATGSGIGTNMQVKVPVQISSAANVDLSTTLPASLAAAATDAADSTEEDPEAAADADDFFIPRSIAPPSPAYVERSYGGPAMWVTGNRAHMARLPAAAVANAQAGGAAPPGYSLVAPRGSVSVAG